jgi:hypothetical protein
MISGSWPWAGRFETTAVLLWLVALPLSARAAEYYVAPDGSDGNPGTAAHPFRTIARAVRAVIPGDTIILQDGVYGNEGVISDGTGGYHGYATPVSISKAGTAEAWITLKAANRGQAVLDCGTSASAIGCDKNIILKAGAAYWSFEDLVFTGGAFGGIGTDAGASNIAIKHCRFENIGQWNTSAQVGMAAIGFDANASAWWIEGNVIHDVGRLSGLIRLNYDHGIYAAGSNVAILNNIFYNLDRGWAIQTADGATNWLIANNTFAFPSSSAGQIMLWNKNDNIRIANNIFFRTVGSAITRSRSVLRGCVVDHNVVSGADTLMPNERDCTTTANQLGGNIAFVNSTAAPYDFHPLKGCPCAGAGTALPMVTDDFDGLPRPADQAPTAGAYQDMPPPPADPGKQGWIRWLLERAARRNGEK